MSWICKPSVLILVVVNLVCGQDVKECGQSVNRYVDLENQATKKVAPVYPAEPGLNVAGKVVVRIVVDKKGNVVSARALCGHPLLVAASVKAATQWKFQRRRVNGKVIKNVGILVFYFKLANREHGY